MLCFARKVHPHAHHRLAQRPGGAVVFLLSDLFERRFGRLVEFVFQDIDAGGRFDQNKRLS
jgi:hypothetical protein